jgi:hypothetical protein
MYKQHKTQLLLSVDLYNSFNFKQNNAYWVLCTQFSSMLREGFVAAYQNTVAAMYYDTCSNRNNKFNYTLYL